MARKEEGRRVLIAAGLRDADGPPPSFVTLPDPKTGRPSTYLQGFGKLQEISWVKSQFSSWFVGDAVLQDGGLYICTPVDPLFILLPLLETARGLREGDGQGMFCDLEQILQNMEHSAAQELTSLLPAQQLQCLCDAKAVGGQEYYRLSDEKALAWLRHKVNQMKDGLLGSPSSAASYASMEPQALAAYAAGMIGEYLRDSWATRLAISLGLPEDTPVPTPTAAYHSPPAMDGDAQRVEKRPKLDPKEAAKHKAAEARAAAKSAKLAKEAKSMRKMSSFFTTRQS